MCQLNFEFLRGNVPFTREREGEGERGRSRGRGNASTRREHERQDSGGGIGKIYTQYTGYMYYYAVWDNPGEHIEVVPFTHAIGPISGDPAELFFNGF